jgi:hypothetical protein
MILPRALERLARRRTGSPIGVVAWYGPDDTRASKAVASIIPGLDADASDLVKWYSDTADLRDDRGRQAFFLCFRRARFIAPAYSGGRSDPPRAPRS